jgi:hypothetical protein
MGVACAFGFVDGSTQALQPGVGGPSRERGATRFEQRCSDGPRRHAGRWF